MEASGITQVHRSVGVVGPGRVGAVLGAALATSGARIVGWTGRESTRPARAMPPLPRLALPELVEGSDVVLLAVRDDQLPGVVADLAALRPSPTPSRRRRVAWHVSGRFGIGVLAPLDADLWSPVAAAPAMTFTGEPTDVGRLPGSRWAVTGDPEGLAAATELIHGFGAVSVAVGEADRTLLHAALSLASNHIGTLERAAADLLRGIKITDPVALLQPLAQAALDDAFGEQARFTGPVSRGDSAAVTEHLRAIAAHAATARLYAAVTRATTAQALAAGVISADQAAAIVAATSGGEE